MAGKGKYYESQFEEATIELLRESHWQYTFGDEIHRKTRLLKKTCGHLLPLSTRTKS